MPQAEFKGLRHVDHLVSSVYVDSVHRCSTHYGQPLCVRFSLGTECRKNIGNNCGCQTVVPELVWTEWRNRYLFAQRLEGK